MKYEVIGYTTYNEVFKTAKYSSKPDYKRLANLSIRWSLKYGAHVRVELKEVV